ncbi:MAG: copper amine oxidase N-terminal domain-containing protein [Clostridia bacterium]|nr:MAG: copper amine oxidase N-terminal domain-containing protein [Clostridia bacterium]
MVGEGSYTVDGQAREMDAVPFVEDGRIFIPVRYLSYALSVAEENVLWDCRTQTVALWPMGLGPDFPSATMFVSPWFSS